MDVLQVGDKHYVKASVIARDLGYTADYVGQLCRSGKIDSKLVGRSWYVNRDSIHEHKKGRYRSTQSKSIQEFKKSIRVNDSEPVPISHFYTHHESKSVPKYSVDNAELIPEVIPEQKKNGRLNLELADSSELRISSEENNYQFKTQKSPKVHFSGRLHLSEYDERSENVPEGGVLIHPKESTAESKKHKKTFKNIVKSAESQLNSDFKVEPELETIAPKNESFEDRLKRASEQTMSVSQSVNKLVDKDQLISKRDSTIAFLILLFGVLFSMGLGFAVVGLQADISFSNASVSTRYEMNWKNVFYTFDHLDLLKNF